MQLFRTSKYCSVIYHTSHFSKGLRMQLTQAAEPASIRECRLGNASLIVLAGKRARVIQILHSIFTFSRYFSSRSPAIYDADLHTNSHLTDLLVGSWRSSDHPVDLPQLLDLEDFFLFLSQATIDPIGPLFVYVVSHYHACKPVN